MSFMPGNSISTNEAIMIARVLSTNNTLTSIGLQGIYLRFSHSFLICIIITLGNKIGDKGVTALAGALSVNTTLTKIELGGMIRKY